MTDGLMVIYNQLKSNELIVSLCEDRIKFYEYPETGDTSKPFIVIDPLDVPVPTVYASNENHANEYLYQIDVESTNRLQVKEIQAEIKKELKKLGFGQLKDGLDEYFKETKRFVDARRYRGLIKEEVL
ncbi:MULTISPECIES: DUF3168 domain-containing protein [unclassified Bacillus (in: firmicutes)]|uniref:DUF3168 domain-containing protein n=1 Tax=unclassified Bacillus (in: firmicutes) TaxID=185979 RepID=UPI001BECB41D|nr:MULTISPECIES: DUF3168 domain-containing protein [unclassified Bacillus (in: firmicutes)]MBT2615127.1 DUF3168 domain-containing protein [Bacillus sp. ISL-78]MBT2628260.1 DUF3168 domain-containing protein [Bacillus sp. ISL-101]